MSEKSLVLNLAEAAELVGMSSQSFYNLTRDRSTVRVKPPIFRIGKRIVVRREALDAWLRELAGAR